MAEFTRARFKGGTAGALNLAHIADLRITRHKVENEERGEYQLTATTTNGDTALLESFTWNEDIRAAARSPEKTASDNAFARLDAYCGQPA